MAASASARDPLLRYLTAQQLTDIEIRKICADAAKEASRMIRDASEIRGAQLALSRQMVTMWKDVGDATKVGIGDAFDAAAESHALFDEQLFGGTGVTDRYWRASMMETARAGIQSYISRKHNGVSLSERVYRNGMLAGGQVNKVVNNGLLLGKSAREIASDVAKYINPDVQGGVSYAAMRLARTEMNNAFHTTQIGQMADSPWVEAAQWSLSGSHPKADVCDEYAHEVHFKGGEPGQYRVEDVPPKPHPHCFCYITPVTMSDDDFLKAFQKGKFDNYINDTMGCNAFA
jgi:hypothetical protein